MTGPGPTEIPDLIRVGTQAIQDRAKQLGLTWTRRIGTVANGDDPSNVKLVLDGDTVSVLGVSMVGVLALGTRVYVDLIPPAGSFITGIVTDSAVLNQALFGAVNHNVVATAGSTASASYVNMPGPATKTLVKNQINSRIRIDFHSTLFSSAVTTAGRFAMNFNSIADGDVAQLFFNAANTHLQVSGTQIFAFAFSGDITVTARWRVVSGAGTLTQNSDDWISFTATEIM